jgi:NAD(P)-dependent dehydrogenase (short-subunit alcohol dehydrogenase family)
MDLDGKVVIITGASAGIGRATALELARRGARVGLIARGRERLESAREEIERAGGVAATALADVSDPQALERAASELEARLGQLDAWVNNAMSAVLAEVVDTTPEEFRRVTEVTYLGSVHGTGIALRRFLPRGEGTIVQVGSALSRRGIPLQASYCGAKHALEGFLESLRAELRHRKVRIHVSLVQLPGVNTPQFDWVRTRLRRHPQPVPPIFQPEVAARAIADAVERPRREIWVGGPTVMTIVGNRIAPWFVDRYLARTNEKAQQTAEIIPADRPDNLFGPPAGDPGAHGMFDARAHGRSLQYELNRRRRAIAAAGAAAAGAAAAAAVTRRST